MVMRLRNNSEFDISIPDDVEEERQKGPDAETSASGLLQWCIRIS